MALSITSGVMALSITKGSDAGLSLSGNRVLAHLDRYGDATVERHCERAAVKFHIAPGAAAASSVARLIAHGPSFSILFHCHGARAERTGEAAIEAGSSPP